MDKSLNSKEKLNQNSEVHLSFAKSIGSCGSDDGQFKNPFLVAIDKRNNIIVADMSNHRNHRIQVLDQSGKMLNKIGSEGSGDGQFNQPNGVAIDKQNNIMWNSN
eukprot:TRINITY_DN2939_c0_g1_i6.p1 TRINITY_DN2939_c0_g1~~TRINITY_DN2939_c0_g1_i6.p1  ORF type:complete len:105 (-),score=17.68 TRINITY_DN2939_c0_g1_i6:207-521(-)